jgi:hypothetical protein
MRIEIYEKYPIRGEYDAEWWADNMPAGTTPPNQSYGYRRTMVLIEQIERPIEIPGNNKEFMVRLTSGEDIVCLGSYDDFCVKLHDLEEEMMIQDEIEEAVMKHFANYNYNK